MNNFELYKFIFDNYHDPLCLFDSHLNIFSMNSIFKNMFNIENISGKIAISEIFGKEYASHLESNFPIKLESNVIKIPKNDEELLISTVFYESSTPPFGMIICSRNFSTIQEKILKNSLSLISIMIRGLVHDMNNILMSISGYTSILRLDSMNLTDAQISYIHEIQKSLYRASNLVQQVQNISADSKAEKVKIDIFSPVKNVFSYISKDISDDISLKLMIPPSRYYIYAEPILITQVFLNLTTNSIKALKKVESKKDKYIQVNVSEVDKKSIIELGISSEKLLHIEFKDNGVGMSNELLTSLLNPTDFMSGDLSVGIPIIYNIVKNNLKGDLKVESIENEYTTFHIYIPQALDFTHPAELELNVEEGTIMIIDDETSVRNVLNIYLSKLGYKIITAKDGHEGINKFKELKEKVDLILLDITLPEMSGEDLFQELKRINPKVKILISSGHTIEDIPKGILSEADGFLNKPYNRTTLVKEMLKVLGTDDN